MRVSILYRHAESGGPWSEVASAEGAREARDELASWPGPRLHHGDLARLSSGKKDLLFVFDADRSSMVEVVRPQRQASWWPLWEGDGASARGMLYDCGRVDPAKVVLAARDCADLSAHLVAGGDQRPAAAVAAARRWARGDGSPQEARAAATAAYDAPYSPASYAAAHAAEAAGAVGHADFVDYAAAAAAMSAAAFSDSGQEEPSMAAVVRARIPLSVLACARVGARDPMPLHGQRRGGRK